MSVHLGALLDNCSWYDINGNFLSSSCSLPIYMYGFVLMLISNMWPILAHLRVTYGLFWLIYESSKSEWPWHWPFTVTRSNVMVPWNSSCMTHWYLIVRTCLPLTVLLLKTFEFFIIFLIIKPKFRKHRKCTEWPLNDLEHYKYKGTESQI